MFYRFSSHYYCCSSIDDSDLMLHFFWRNLIHVPVLKLLNFLRFQSLKLLKSCLFRFTKIRGCTLSIDPQNTEVGNKVISAEEHLILILQFLATDECFRSLSFQIRISSRTMPYTIKSVCNTIVKYLISLYLRVSSKEDQWLSIAEKFESPW